MLNDSTFLTPECLSPESEVGSVVALNYLADLLPVKEALLLLVEATKIPSRALVGRSCLRHLVSLFCIPFCSVTLFLSLLEPYSVRGQPYRLRGRSSAPASFPGFEHSDPNADI